MAKQHPRPIQDQPSSAQPVPTTVTDQQPLGPLRSEVGDGALGTKIATVAAVGVAAALIEVDWIPGVLLGVAAMLAPNLLPRMGQGLRPLVKGAVRAGYSAFEKTRETVAEAGEQFQDIVAEVRAERGPSGVPTEGDRAAEAATEHA